MEQSALFQIKKFWELQCKKFSVNWEKVFEVSGPVLFVVIYFVNYLCMGWLGVLHVQQNKNLLIMEPKYLKKSNLGAIQNFLPTFVFSLTIWGEKNYFLLSLGEYYFGFLYVWSDSCGLDCISG